MTKKKHFYKIVATSHSYADAYIKISGPKGGDLEKIADLDCKKWLAENAIPNEPPKFSPVYIETLLFTAIHNIINDKKYPLNLNVFGREIEGLHIDCPFDVQMPEGPFLVDESLNLLGERTWTETMYQYKGKRKNAIDSYKDAVMAKLQFQEEKGKANSDRTIESLDRKIDETQIFILRHLPTLDGLILAQQENMPTLLTYLTLPLVTSEEMRTIALKVNDILFETDTLFENGFDVFSKNQKISRDIISHFIRALDGATDLDLDLPIEILGTSLEWQIVGVFNSIGDVMQDVKSLYNRSEKFLEKIKYALKSYFNGQFREIHRKDRTITPPVDDLCYFTVDGRRSPTMGNRVNYPGLALYSNEGNPRDLEGTEDEPDSDRFLCQQLVFDPHPRRPRSMSDTGVGGSDRAEEKLINKKVGKARGVEVVITVAECMNGIEMSFDGIDVPYLFEDECSDEIDIEYDIEGETVNISEMHSKGTNEQKLSGKIKAWFKLKKSYYMCLKILNDIISRSKEEWEKDGDNSNFVFILEKPHIFDENRTKNAILSIKCVIKMLANLFKSIEEQRTVFLDDFTKKIEIAKKTPPMQRLNVEEIAAEKEMVLKADTVLQRWVTGYLLSEVVIVNGRNRQR
ncbi:hypothetical protein HOH45_04075 [bacterium]|nr:hypothetical protein [bacterium]